VLAVMLAAGAALPPAQARGKAQNPGGSPAGTALPALEALVTIRGSAAVTLDQAVARWQATNVSSPDSITPERARQFLDLLADEAVLTAAAEKAAPAWTDDDRAAHAQLEDRLVLRAALDSVLDATRRAEPDSATDAQSVGLRARTRVVQALAIRWDAARVGRLTAAFRALPRLTADSTLAAQLRMLAVTPVLSRADSAGAIARAGRDSVTGRDVVASWSRIGMERRPRIESDEHVRNLAENLLFERALRAAAARGSFRHDPSIRAVIEAHARQTTLQRWLEHEVLAAIPDDSSAVRDYFAAHRAEWALPLRVRGIRLTLGDRASAERIALQLRDAAAADTLAARSLRRGADYRFEVTAASDSVLFRRALAAGPGAVVGPVADASGWWVARVGVVVPGRERSFDEVADAVTQRWYASEAERRTLALATRLRAASHAEIAPGAEDALVRELRGTTLGAGADVNPR